MIRLGKANLMRRLFCDDRLCMMVGKTRIVPSPINYCIFAAIMNIF